MDAENPAFLPREGLDELIVALKGAGYRCLGPQVRDGAILYEELETAADLPRGVRETQSPGSYRLTEATDSPRCFAWATGPQALKPQLFAPREMLWQVARDGQGRLDFTPLPPEPDKLAVIGVKACDLAALDLQDKHFLAAGNEDEPYSRRREGLLLVAVNCTHPAATCFCVSTGDGPQAEQGYDLVMDELDDGYVVRSGSSAGARVLGQLDLQPVTGDRQAAVEAERAAARDAQQRTLPSRNLREPLFDAWNHPRWKDVAARCLSCGNCTLVCPTCFCHAHNEVGELDGSAATHYREWDSCFTRQHSYIHGITIRAETLPRYRQWLTHKLGSWHDQYGRSGCVGCGRCIAWCPVGIDITEEAHALMEESAS